MSYSKLVDLLYLADREALLRFGRPITTDRYVLTDQGPSLSMVNDLITREPVLSNVWHRYISSLQNYPKVSLLRDASELEELSEAEIGLINSIYNAYGKLDHREISILSRGFPEWHDPQGTKIPLEYIDILKAGGKTASEADAICSELESLAVVIAHVEPYRSGALVD